MKNLIGEASCRICQESFSTTVTGLFHSIAVPKEIQVLKTIFERYLGKISDAITLHDRVVQGYLL